MATTVPHRLTGSQIPTDEVDVALAEFGPELFGLALTITGSTADAEDAYQAAWMQAATHWAELRNPRKRRSWLASVVARSALRTRRRRLTWARRHPPISEAQGLGAMMVWDPSLGTALLELTDRQRAVVALHYGHGYSLDETAELLRCSKGTVRSHLARSLTTLRRTLHDDED
jgi:DNA-directed RNA polymerase specialized sigma24 family protein